MHQEEPGTISLEWKISIFCVTPLLTQIGKLGAIEVPGNIDGLIFLPL